MILLLSSAFIGMCVDIILMKTLNLKRYPGTFIISLCVMYILCKAFDSQLMIIKGFLFAQILIFAGFTDAKTKLIPDKVHIAIFLVALIGFEPVGSALGLTFVPLPFLIAALSKKGVLGGGDIKLMGACGFLLGLERGYVASLIGLILAIIASKVFKSYKATGIPLAPYLGIGSFIAYIIH